MVQIVAHSPNKEATCYQCKARLSYNYSDMSFSLERDYGGGCDRVARITCPACGARPSVPLNF